MNRVAQKRLILLLVVYIAVGRAFAVDIKSLGAIPEGSLDGKLAPWKGGLPMSSQEYDEFRGELLQQKPLFVIDSNNYQEFKETLTEGQIALFEKYPETFKMPIYESVRNARYPDWYFERLSSERTAKLDGAGKTVLSFDGAVPFPFPSGGLEAIWNHLTRWRGVHCVRDETEGIVYPNGERKQLKIRKDVSFENYRLAQAASHGKPLDLDDRSPWLFYTSYILSPSSLSGGAVLVIDYLNSNRFPRQSWSYDSSQRRIKRLPSLAYDSPAILSDSLRTTDDIDMFNGSPDRYDWRLVGRTLKYIPYNNERLASKNTEMDAFLGPKHLDPEYMRYELHRVWVVEATLKPEYFHSYSKRRFYLDEDSWSVAAVDQYNRLDELWRVSMAYLKYFNDAAMTYTAADVFHDLTTGAYNVTSLINEGRQSCSPDYPPKGYFSPARLRSIAR